MYTCSRKVKQVEHMWICLTSIYNHRYWMQGSSQSSSAIQLHPARTVPHPAVTATLTVCYKPNSSAVWHWGNTDWNVMWLIKWLYVKCMWRAPYISFLAPSPPHVLMHRSDFSHRSTDRFVFIDPKVLICSGARQHLHTELLGKRFLETESKWIIAIIIVATTTKWDS